MGRSKRLESQDLPPADSSSEEEQEPSEEENDVVVEEDDVEEEEEEDEEEKDGSPVKKTTVTPSSDDDDDDSESDSGTDSDGTQPSPTASAFTIKPIVSKPIDDVTKPKKSASKPSTSAAKSGSKRPADTVPVEPESKNKKKRASNGGDDNEEAKKGSGVQRVWSEDDEIALLKGMSEYRTLKGSDPSSDMGGFYEFIKKSMHFDLSKTQLVDKIRRLKKKYQNNVQKGEDPVFAKPHEQRAFVLSKKIWGVEANNGVADSGKGGKTKAKQTSSASNSKANTTTTSVITTPITLALASTKNPVLNVEAKANGDGEAKANGGDGEENGEVKGDFWSNYPCLKGWLEMGGNDLALPEFGKSFLKAKMSLIGNKKAEELEEKLRDLQEEEFKLYLRRVELVKQQTELVLETLRASRS